MMSGLEIHYELARDIRYSDAAWPDLDLVTTNGPLRVSLYCTGPAVLSISVSQGASTSPHGRIGSSRSRSNTLVCASFRYLGAVPAQLPCCFGPTDMSPGWETEPIGASLTR